MLCVERLRASSVAISVTPVTNSKIVDVNSMTTSVEHSVVNENMWKRYVGNGMSDSLQMVKTFEVLVNRRNFTLMVSAYYRSKVYKTG
jgi:hypothetical protein